MLGHRSNYHGLLRQTSREYSNNVAKRDKSSREKGQFIQATSQTYQNRLYCNDISNKKVGKIVRNQKSLADSMKENEYHEIKTNEKLNTTKYRDFGVIKKRGLNLTSLSVLPAKQRIHGKKLDMELTLTVEPQFNKQEQMQTPKFAGNSAMKQISRQYQLVKQTKQHLLPDHNLKNRQH